MIALITPTGARPKQIELCVEWMKEQTYKGKVLWVIIDDAIPITTDFIKNDFKENWNVECLYPRPAWRNGQNTQKRNLMVGINEVEKYNNVEYVFIIEDDDYYFPDYLEKMLKRLKGYDVAGQTKTLYFSVVDGTVKRYSNKNHSSLFQTAFSINQVPAFKHVLMNDRDTFIDTYFWKSLKRVRVNLFNSLDLSIGIKGLSGRKGIGIGHKIRSNKVGKGQILSKLKSLIGDDYLKYM